MGESLVGTPLEQALGPLVAELHVRHDVVDAIHLLLLGLARWAPVFTLTPFVGGRLVPAPIKMALTVMMAFWLLPSLSAEAPVPLAIGGVTWWALVLKEVLVGFVLAFGGGLIFWAAEMAGRFIDNVRGTTSANLMVPQVAVQSSLLGDFYFQLFIVLYVAGGGHRWFLAAVFESYDILPPLAVEIALESTTQGFLVGVGALFSLALKLIAPALVVIMLMDVLLGVANRLAPQLDVFFLSLSLKAAVGSLVVALSLYYLLHLGTDLFETHHRWLGSTLGLQGAENNV